MDELRTTKNSLRSFKNLKLSLFAKGVPERGRDYFLTL